MTPKSFASTSARTGGPEAAARTARYRALDDARRDAPVLLAHTLDDQAETVLLGLGRGSGARSIAGMRPCDPPWYRPLLGIRRALTHAACAELGLTPWQDPHNADRRFTRTRLRNEVLPLLEEVLGGGVAEALARTATALREDTDTLDELARQALAEVGAGGGLDTGRLAALPEAVRRRVIRGWLLAGGASGLTDKQIRGVDTLVTAWRGQGGVAVGSPLRSQRLIAGRRDGMLTLHTSSRSEGAWHAVVVPEQTAELYPGDIKSVLLSSETIQTKVAELGAQIGEDYRETIDANGQDLLLVTVLKGAVFFVTDLARAIPLPTQLEFMAVSSYGSSTSSSGVVRILKDLDRDINDRDVLIVEDIVDSGLTLSWLLRNLATRHPRSLRVCTLMRKPDAVRADVDIAYVGFDIPNEFVVGYGLDYAERYRDLPYIGTLDPKVYEQL